MRVLVIDDDRQARNATKRLLVAAGHSVVAVSTLDGAAAELDHPVGAQAQAIITDHDLGEERTGGEAVASLRTFLRPPAIVVVFTGNPREASKVVPAGVHVVKKPDIRAVLEALQ